MVTGKNAAVAVRPAAWPHPACQPFEKSQTDIAFIQATGSGAAGTAYALQAYQRYQAGQTDPCLIHLAQSKR